MIMANKKAKPSLLRAIAGDKNIDKIGTFKESTGGGTPLAKGEKLKDHPEAKRVQQPRDEEGKFTYNSANAKPLKYGPSRGNTIPPFLKGVKLTFAIKKGDKINYNGLIYLAGVDMTANEFFNKCKEMIFGKGFDGLDNVKLDAKKGKKSNEEKEIISKGEQGIIAPENKKGQVSKYTTMTYGEFLQTIEKYMDEVKDKKPKNNKSVKKIEKDQNQVNENSGDMTLSEQAKKDPKEFMKNNKDSISEIIKMVPDAKPSDIVEIMSGGEFKSFDELKQLIKNNLN